MNQKDVVIPEAHESITRGLEEFGKGHSPVLDTIALDPNMAVEKGKEIANTVLVTNYGKQILGLDHPGVSMRFLVQIEYLVECSLSSSVSRLSMTSSVQPLLSHSGKPTSPLSVVCTVVT